jgi:hypothetical protein
MPHFNVLLRLTHPDVIKRSLLHKASDHNNNSKDAKKIEIKLWAVGHELSRKLKILWSRLSTAVQTAEEERRQNRDI